MKGWHFTRLDNDDGRRIEPYVRLTIEGPPVLYGRGFYASRRIIDALDYAHGEYVFWVELGGDIMYGADQSVATELTALWGLDATAVLCDFRRRCALDVIELWDAPEVVVRYLRTGDESLRADARVAAGDAICAYETVAGDSALSAFWAVSSAFWANGDSAVAAEYTARYAARAAAGARNVARAKQNRRLAAMIAAARKKKGVEKQEAK